MSKATKRKHVTREVLNEYTLPEDHQRIVKVTASRGNNLHEVQTTTGEQFLVSMPTRFRKYVWIKRGDFVIVDPIMEGDKVKAEISTILYPKQIKYIQKEGLWPDEFKSKPPGQDESDIVHSANNLDPGTITKDMSKISLGDDCISPAVQEDSDSDSDSNNDDDLFVNTNHPSVTYYYSESDEEEEEEGADEGVDEGGER